MGHYPRAQLCFCHRLPPIYEKFNGREGQFMNRGYAFQAPSWNAAFPHQILLTKACPFYNFYQL